MKLYGGSGSASTYTPLLTAAELGILDELDFEIIDMQKGQHKQPAYLAKHPFGKVPSFEDEDTGAAFYESRAIARYLVAKKSASKLMPLRGEADQDEKAYLKALATFETAASVEIANIAPHRGTLMWELVVKPRRKMEPDQAKIAEGKAALAASLDVYEKLLSRPGQSYLCGSEFCLVDLFHIPHFDKFAKVGCMDLINDRPNVKRWWNDVISRPSVKQVGDKYPAFAQAQA